MSALLKASVQVINLFVPLSGEEAFIWSLNIVRRRVSVDNPHVQDAVGGLFPEELDRNVAFVFIIYHHPWWVVR